MTPATDPTRGDSAHAFIQHAAIIHSFQFNINRFHTSPIQHNTSRLFHKAGSAPRFPVSALEYISGRQIRKRRYGLPTRFPQVDIFSFKARSSTQVWALCSKTRTLREADISWFRHVASENRACSRSMRCVTLAARDSCAIFVSLAHRPVPPQRRGLWWPKWEKTASLNARDVLWY